MLTETELYHINKLRDTWISNGAKENFELYIPKKYKLTVEDWYFVNVEYWSKKDKEWVSIELVNPENDN